MTGMIVLPVDISSEGIRRLEAQLEREIRTGADLGSRHGQIACLSGSILRSLETLRKAMLHLTGELPDGDPMVGRLREATESMTRLARAVMDYARLHDPKGRQAT